MKLILASASPRRRELLQQVGIAIEVHSADVVEHEDERWQADELALANARLKAQAVYEKRPGELVLGADTVVVLDGTVLGKPRDHAEATRSLQALSGRAHHVVTGVAIVGPETDAEISWTTTTEVHFRPLNPDEIARYVVSGEPMDKAGAYGIQAGAAHFVRSISGSYTNVVGLPLAEVVEHLQILEQR